MNNLAVNTLSPPLANDEIERVSTALAGFSPAQLQWVSGYVAGLAASVVAPSPRPETGRALKILYGSQTGNGEAVATTLTGRVQAAGFVADCQSLADFRPAQLKRESLVVFVVSTHGEGDPPDDAELFHEYLLSSRAPQLNNLRYAVLALGDSSYVNFCQTGRELDNRLAELGGKRLVPIVECDVDFEDEAESWSSGIIADLPEWLDSAPGTLRLRAVDTKKIYTKTNPYAAPVLVNQQITGGGSSKDVRHIELSIEHSGLVYEPGDALAVLALNPPALVQQFIKYLGARATDEVVFGEERVTLEDALSRHVEITACNPRFVRAWFELTGARELGELLADGQQSVLAEFLQEHQVIDVLRRFPAPVTADRLVPMLRRLGPRSYSIASSPRANPGEVHLTVAAVRYEAFGSTHWGAASTHLVDRIREGDTLAVFVEPNSRFRLPDDDATDIIMVGPGTGVAPFRAFVEERAERQASGRNWLFFGDRNFSSDFLYQLEWHRHLKQGSLDRLDVAFSRDQEHKVYVQDRIRQRAAEIYEWIEGGAVIYVCGDAKRMAQDVNDAFTDVIAGHGNLDSETAAARLAELRRTGRYRRDVY